MKNSCVGLTLAERTVVIASRSPRRSDDCHFDKVKAKRAMSLTA